MDFPVDRYRRAGASAEQIAEHYDAFTKLPDGAQASLVQRIAGMADADLHELIDRAEHHGEPEDAEDDESEGENPEPVQGVAGPPADPAAIVAPVRPEPPAA